MGIILALLSAALGTSKDVVSKSLASRVNPDVSTLASFLFPLPFYAVILAVAWLGGYEVLSFSSKFLLLIGLRSLSDACAEGCKMRALAHGDMSLVSSFVSLAPIVLLFLSPLITGDAIHPHEVVAVVLIVSGSLFLIRRDKETGGIIQLKAILYSCAAAVAFAFNACFDRLAVNDAGPILSGFGVTFLAGVVTAPLALRHTGCFTRMQENGKGFLVRGFLETLFMVMKLWALVYLPAHIVAGVSRFTLLFNVIAGRFVFREGDISRKALATLLMYLGLAIFFFV